MKIKGEALFFIGIATISIIIVVGAVLFSGSSQQAPSEDLLVKSDSQVKGAKNAKATLVEFADFQCPACRMAFPLIKQLEADYGKDLRIVFRHFPLPAHQNATLAAEASEAAGEQGKFWEYHDILYERQTEWEGLSSPREKFESYANELKLDLNRFRKALDEHKFLAKIEADKKDGSALGVNSTPTLFLNDQKMVGVPELPDLKEKIDKILADTN